MWGMTFFVAIAIQTALINDDRLAKNADFDASLQQITDFCSEASQRSGVELSVSRELRDLKVDVFVDKRPLRETLDKVAKVLNCSWTPTDKGYALTMEIPLQNRERNFNKAEYDLSLKDLELQLWANEYVAGKMPGSTQLRKWRQSSTFPFQRKIVEPFEQDYSVASQSADQTKTKTALDKLTAIKKAFSSFLTGRTLSQFDSSARKQFWNGEPFISSTFPESQYKLFLSDLIQVGDPLPLSNGNSTDGEYQACFLMKFDPIEGRLKVNRLTFSKLPDELGGSPVTSQSSEGTNAFATNNSVADELKKMPFYQDLASWSDSSKTPPQFADRQFSKADEWPSPWIGSKRRLGEHLKWLHLSTGIPIVAQADRSGLSNLANLDRRFDTVPKYLTDLMTRFGTYCKKDGDFLIARTFRFWSHRLHETPEAIWQQIEPKDLKFKPSLEDYAQMSLLVRRDQVLNRDKEYPLSKIDLAPLKYAYHALRAYGSLSPAQQAAARQKGGIPVSNLNSSQKQEIITSFLNLIVDAGTCSYDLARTLAKKNLSSESLQNLRFRIEASAPSQRKDFGEEINDRGQVVQQRQPSTYKASQIQFTFAFSDTESLSQSVDIKQ